MTKATAQDEVRFADPATTASERSYFALMLWIAVFNKAMAISNDDANWGQSKLQLTPGQQTLILQTLAPIAAAGPSPDVAKKLFENVGNKLATEFFATPIRVTGFQQEEGQEDGNGLANINYAQAALVIEDLGKQIASGALAAGQTYIYDPRDGCILEKILSVAP